MAGLLASSAANPSKSGWASCRLWIWLAQRGQLAQATSGLGSSELPEPLLAVCGKATFLN